jgi:hypothetical protein
VPEVTVLDVNESLTLPVELTLLENHEVGTDQARQGVIAGQVVDGSTGQAVAGATVTLSHLPLPSTASSQQSPRMTRTSAMADEDGRFQFDELPTGLFGIRADAPGYRMGFFGQLSANDPYGSNSRIELAASDRVADLKVSMWPTSSIRGFVMDERGEPIVGARVHALEREYVGGQLAWVPGRLARATDDRGSYVLSDLAPGDYLVALQSARNDGSTSYDAAFHPAASRASGATVIALVSGQSRTDVNITAPIRAAMRLVPISGRLLGDGSSLPPMTLSLVPPDTEDGVLDLEALTTRSDAMGAFRFPSVPTGRYRLIAAAFPTFRGQGLGAFTGTGGSFTGLTWGYPVPPAQFAPPPVPQAPTWVLDRMLAVDGAMEDLEMPLQQGARIRGRLVLEGDGTPPPVGALRGVPVLARPAYMRSLENVAIGGTEADGRFETVGLPPGRYVVMPIHDHPQSASALQAWRVVSIRVDGRETIGQPIDLGTTDVTDVEVVLTNRQMQFSGVVRDPSGRPIPWTRIILFPRDRRSGATT